MGLGGFLAAKSDAEHYESERRREEREVQEIPDEEAREVQKVFADYGLSQEDSVPVVQALTRKPKEWVDFMMRFELGLEEPDPRRAVQSARTIAVSYVAGGIIPLAPLHGSAQCSPGAGMVGVGDADRSGRLRLRQGPLHRRPAGAIGLQTVVIGGLAAGAAFLLAKLIS